MPEQPIYIKLQLKDEFSPALSKIGSSINSVAKLLPAVFSTAAVAGFISTMKKAVEASAEHELAIKKVSVAVENAGYSWQNTKQKVIDFADNMQRMTTYGDEQTLQLIQELVPYTKNLDMAMMGAKVAMDVSASGMFDLGTAGRYVGMAMQGQVEILGRYIPELRRANDEQLKTMTTAEKTAYALGVLKEKFGGMAAAEIGTFTGATKQMNNAWSDLMRTLGNFITQNPKVIDAIRATKEAVESATFLIEISQPKSPVEEIINREFAERDRILSEYGMREHTTAYQQQLAEFLRLQKDYQNQLAQITIEGNEIIKSIEASYGDAKKSLSLQDKQFFVQKELEQVELILNTARIDEATQQKLFNKKMQLKLAEKNIQKEIFKETLGYQLQMMNSFAQVTAGLAQLTGKTWLDVASVMIQAFADATKTIVEMEILKAIATGQYWKAAAGAAALAAITVKAVVGLENIKKRQEALDKEWTTTVPAMAEGGIVKRPTMALIGEAGPEAVIPLNRNRLNHNRILDTSKNIIVNIHNEMHDFTIRDESDIEILARKISDIFSRETERIW